MPAKDNVKTEEQGYRPPDGPDQKGVLNTLNRVFSTFREQLSTEVPKPFTGNAKIAVDTFNDIVAGLKLESGRPRAITIRAAKASATEIDLTWTDDFNNADGYRVERCQGYGCQDFDEIEQLVSSARGFHDANLSPATYRYKVVAFNARGETVSNTVDVTLQTSE